ncbi:MAG: endonuclease/exonuclease/phosphatase family protein [Candidatus Paceibacterota bacterium]
MSVPYGLAIFVKKNIKILSHHHDYIFGTGNESLSDDARTHKRLIQTVCISHNGSPVAISNVHGLWNGQGKTDTTDRIEQSNKIKTHIKKFEHPVILVGDFNLLPDTESLAIIRHEMRDLIKEYNITSTRSKLYTKHEKPVLFADYIFTSPEIKVDDFKVLPDVVSDHLPLLLDFS